MDRILTNFSRSWRSVAQPIAAGPPGCTSHEVWHLLKVWVVQHVHTLPSGQEDVKMIGVYADLQSAEEAVNRLKTQPGFCNHPVIIDPALSDATDGFFLDEYEVGEDHWAEGFGTLVGDQEYSDTDRDHT